MPAVAGGDPAQGAGMPAAPQAPTPLLDAVAAAQRALDAARAKNTPKAAPPRVAAAQRATARRRSRGSGTPGEQEEGQGPSVGRSREPPLWGPEAAPGVWFFTVDFFMSIQHFEGEYCQHGAALKYLREICEAA